MFLTKYDMQVLTGDARSSEVEKEGLIWAIGRWFVKFVDEASAQNSGLMWIPATNTFARSDGKQRAIDIYINREEISSLCAVIGPQGVRCIDAMLIQIVADKVTAVLILRKTTDFSRLESWLLRCSEHSRFESSHVISCHLTYVTSCRVILCVAGGGRQELHRHQQERALQVQQRHGRPRPSGGHGGLRLLHDGVGEGGRGAGSARGACTHSTSTSTN